MTLWQWAKPILLITLCVIWPIWLARRHRRLVPDPGRREAAKTRARKIGAGFPVGCLVYCVALAAMLAGFPWWDRSQPASTARDAVLVVVVVGGVLVTAHLYVGARRSRRLYDRVVRANFYLCPDCHYSLVGHAGGGTCPECGYTFDYETLVRDWGDVWKLAWKHRAEQ